MCWLTWRLTSSVHCWPIHQKSYNTRLIPDTNLFLRFWVRRTACCPCIPFSWIPGPVRIPYRSTVEKSRVSNSGTWDWSHSSVPIQLRSQSTLRNRTLFFKRLGKKAPRITDNYYGICTNVLFMFGVITTRDSREQCIVCM